MRTGLPWILDNCKPSDLVINTHSTWVCALSSEGRAFASVRVPGCAVSCDGVSAISCVSAFASDWVYALSSEGRALAGVWVPLSQGAQSLVTGLAQILASALLQANDWHPRCWLRNNLISSLNSSTWRDNPAWLSAYFSLPVVARTYVRCARLDSRSIDSCSLALLSCASYRLATFSASSSFAGFFLVFLPAISDYLKHRAGVMQIVSCYLLYVW